MHLLPSLALTTIGLLLPAAGARAAVVEALDLEGMTRAADLVVVVKVGKPSARFVDDGRRIVTDTPVIVESAIKGEPAPTLLVRTSGGIIGELGQHVAGSAQLMEGELAVLFLEQRPASEGDLAHCLVVGMAQGKFELRHDPSGNPVVVRDLGALRFATGTETASHPALRTQYYADRFLRQIQQIVLRQAETPEPVSPTAPPAPAQETTY